MPVHVGEESLRGLSLFETYLTSELVITPTDSSWREILVADKERFLKDAATNVVIIIEKLCHNYRKTLS